MVLRRCSSGSEKKGKGELPSDQRLLALLSLWYSLWNKDRYTRLATWCRGWVSATAHGALPDENIFDVSFGLQLRVEDAIMLGKPLDGLMLDSTLR